MLENLSVWTKRIAFPKPGCPSLGFGEEYWVKDPERYEGCEQLRNRLKSLGRNPTKEKLVYELTSHLLSEVVVAAGGLERSMLQLRKAHDVLRNYISEHNIKPEDGIPYNLSLEGSVEAVYAFFDVLSWSRTVVERLKRKPVDRKKFSAQGLIPAIELKSLKSRCEELFEQLKRGPVGEARFLTNFVLHSSMLQHPYSGVPIKGSGIILPIPDTSDGLVCHLNSLTWNQKRDGFTFAEELWMTTKNFIDNLLDAFEKGVPKRFQNAKQATP